MAAGGCVHLLTLTLEIIITKHKGLSVMGGAGREILTLADGAASWTIKDMRTQRGRHSHELSL